MFGKKQLQVQLREALGALEGDRAAFGNRIRELLGDRDKYRAELDQALESISGYEGQVNTLVEEAERNATINQALADENRDLVRQLELFRALLAQIKIEVKLPARKRA